MDEDIWIGQTVTVWGQPVHFHIRGEGQPVLLLHGNGSLGQEIACAFPNVPGIQWIAPDRPGYGLSGAIGASDPATGGAWVRAFLDALGHHSRVTLVAHSIGSAPALYAAAAFPQYFRRVVLVAPFCRPTPERLMLHLRATVAPVIGPVVRRYIVPLVAEWFRDRLIAAYVTPRPHKALERFPLQYAARSLPQAAEELRAFNRLIRETERVLKVRVPVSVLAGETDITAPPDWHLPWLKERLRGWCRVVRLPTGHGVHHDAWMAVLREILAVD